MVGERGGGRIRVGCVRVHDVTVVVIGVLMHH